MVMRDPLVGAAAPAAWTAGLRPASRGSAKPAPMTLRHVDFRGAPAHFVRCPQRLIKIKEQGRCYDRRRKENRMLESTITSRGQTTVPKAVREALALKAGDRVRYTIEGSVVRIRPLRPISRLRGIVRHQGPPLSLEDMDRAIAEGACES